MKKIIDNLFEIDLDQPVDTGGMFDVYKTTDIEKNEPLIIKILKEEYSKDENVVKRFHKYYSDFQVKVKSLKNLVKIPKTGGTVGETVYMVQEYIQGQTLDDFLKNNQGIKAKDFIPIFEQICDGLHNLHLRNLVHYKIMPKNILIAKNKNNENQVRIIGFGSLYCILDNKNILESIKSKTENFIAPEIISTTDPDSITSVCDVYSLGQIVKTLPFKIDEGILAKAIDPDPSKRYQKIRDFSGESQKLLSDLETTEKKDEIKPDSDAPVNETENEFIKSLPDQLPLQTAARESILIIPLREELKIPKNSNIQIDILNKPDKAKLSNGIFSWYPTESKDYQLKLKVFNKSTQKEVAIPIKVKQVISKDDWKIETLYSAKADQVLKFNIKNPNPNQYKIVLEQKPNNVSGYNYNENSGNFEWKLNNSCAGNHKFQFKKFEMQNPQNATTKDIFINIEEVKTKPQKPEKPEKQKPKRVESTSGQESDMKKILRAFSWEYNWPVFIGLAFAVIVFDIEYFIGFGSLIVIEGLYILIAGNSNKFQDYLKNK